MKYTWIPMALAILMLGAGTISAAPMPDHPTAGSAMKHEGSGTKPIATPVAMESAPKVEAVTAPVAEHPTAGSAMKHEGSDMKPMEHPGMGSGTKPAALAPEVKPDGLAAKADGIAAKKDELAAKVENLGNKVEDAGSKLRSKPMDHPSMGSGMKHQGSGTK